MNTEIRSTSAEHLPYFFLRDEMVKHFQAYLAELHNNPEQSFDYSHVTAILNELLAIVTENKIESRTVERNIAEAKILFDNVLKKEPRPSNSAIGLGMEYAKNLSVS